MSKSNHDIDGDDDGTKEFSKDENADEVNGFTPNVMNMMTAMHGNGIVEAKTN